MKTIEVKQYSFNELSDAAKGVAINNFFDINIFDGWWDFAFYDFKEKAKQIGFNVDNIYFSGFWSQGDGAMFEYSIYGDSKLWNDFVDGLNLSSMRKNWLKNQGLPYATGKHRGHYYHSNCCSHSIGVESNVSWSAAPLFNNWIESFSNDFASFVENEYQDLCSDLYKTLMEEYEYLTSKDAIIESIEANNYEFLEDGTRF